MVSSKRNIQNSVNVILDTSTLFSALKYPEGNEAKILWLAGNDHCSIYLLDYVLEELKEVFKRKGVDENLVRDLIETYDNISIFELEDISGSDAQYAKRIIDDVEDRPIFLFVKGVIEKEPDIYFISGDKGFFKEKVVNELSNRVIRTSDFLKLFDHEGI